MDRDEFIIPVGSGANHGSKASECLLGQAV